MTEPTLADLIRIARSVQDSGGNYGDELRAVDRAGRADERRELLDVLAPIMEEAGQALFDDAQFRGASAFEVATGLQVVADALSMRGPIQYYDTLCGGGDDA